jgi:pimeloyl-ACP methyl ester carboxylesterase
VESEWGEPGSPALCVWHDLDSVGAAALGEVARVLARDYGFHVVSSRCGNGRDVPAEACLGLLDALGLEETVVMGHASGAALACHAAAASPERVVALVLLEGGHVDEGALRPSDVYVEIDRAGHPRPPADRDRAARPGGAQRAVDRALPGDAAGRGRPAHAGLGP